MSKQFLTDVIQEASGSTATDAKRVAAAVIEAIQNEILVDGRFTLPGFGTFTLKETPARDRRNPRTGEKIKGKAGATVKFKAAPIFRESALAATKKAKRKAARDSKAPSK